MGSSLPKHEHNDNEPFTHLVHAIASLNTKRTKDYCKSLVGCEFHGQTNTSSDNDTDKTTIKDILHLGLYLQLLDKVIRKYEPKYLTIDEEFKDVLSHIALKRKNANESTEACYKRLLHDSERFVKIYRKRGILTEQCDTEEYWGTRQQLLSAKVVSDHVDDENGALDAVFGVLLNPTGGRVGPGDSGIVHQIFFDDTGILAYHSAVHDGFGYLATQHNIGPGYDYIRQQKDPKDIFAGQRTGLKFWKEVFQERSKTKSVYEVFKV